MDWRREYVDQLSSAHQNDWERARQLKASKVPDHLLMPTPSRIILGHRMSVDDRKTVIDIAKSKRIPIFEMAPATDSFRLTVRPLEDVFGAQNSPPRSA